LQQWHDYLYVVEMDQVYGCPHQVCMVEMVGFRQVMWFVMLKSAKDRVLGVNTPGQ
jgi:hypothetical protein